MSLLALLLITASAFMHASWNYLAKRSNGGFGFVWLYMTVSTAIYAPAVICLIIVIPVDIGWIEIGFMAGSAVIHLIYSLLLQKGYSIGDFSIVYPVCRGTGPLIAAISATFIYGEHLTFSTVIGIVLITVSIFIITGGIQAIKQANTLVPLLYGLVIGVAIACYTLLDKGAVSIVFIPPLLLSYGIVIGQVIILSLFIVPYWKEVQYMWRYHRKEAIGVGVLNQLAYILVLTALTFTPVSHVAPIREISIIIGTLMGSRLLSEGLGLRRTAASITMVIGVITIALSGG